MIIWIIWLLVSEQFTTSMSISWTRQLLLVFIQVLHHFLKSKEFMETSSTWISLVIVLIHIIHLLYLFIFVCNQLAHVHLLRALHWLQDERIFLSCCWAWGHILAGLHIPETLASGYRVGIESKISVDVVFHACTPLHIDVNLVDFYIGVDICGCLTIIISCHRGTLCLDTEFIVEFNAMGNGGCERALPTILLLFLLCSLSVNLSSVVHGFSVEGCFGISHKSDYYPHQVKSGQNDESHQKLLCSMFLINKSISLPTKEYLPSRVKLLRMKMIPIVN